MLWEQHPRKQTADGQTREATSISKIIKAKNANKSEGTVRMMEKALKNILLVYLFFSYLTCGHGAIERTYGPIWRTGTAGPGPPALDSAAPPPSPPASRGDPGCAAPISQPPLQLSKAM